jgi:hypothetical protein
VAEEKRIQKTSPKNVQSPNNENESLPPGIEPIIESLPKEHRNEIRSFLSFMMKSDGPSRSSLFNKFNDKHITQFIEQLDRHDSREYEISKDKSKKNFGITVLAILITVALLVFFTMTLSTSNPALFKEIISILIYGGLGFIGGFGVGRSSKKSD